METPSKKIIEKIKEEHITPDSRFKLNWKSYLFWFLWGLTITLGALFFSLIILSFLDLELYIFRYFKLNRTIFMLVRTAPYLWIIFSTLALVSGFLAIRKTRRGYRYSLLFVTSLGVLIISILGVIFHIVKVNDRVGREISRGMPGHCGAAFPMEGRWSSPEEKMLGGEITEVKTEYIILINFQDETWEVYYSPETEMRLRNPLAPGLRVGVIGEKTGERKFKADFIQSFPKRCFCQGCCEPGEKPFKKHRK